MARLIVNARTPGIDSREVSASSCTDAETVFAYRRLAELFAVLLAEQQVESVLKRIAETLRRLVACDDLVVWEAVSGDRLRPQLVEGRDADQLRALDIGVGEGITGHACMTREPVCSNRADLDVRAGHVPGTEVEPEAIVCLPLLARSELLGALSLYRSGTTGFSSSEFELIQHFAEVAALALANARNQAALESLARTDDLTGLANRRHLNEQLDRELARARRLGEPLTLIFVDLDDFKQINDDRGHLAGDDALRKVAEIFSNRLRKHDVAARLGGDEFALLLPRTDDRQARLIGQRLARAIYARSGIRVSIGVATTREAAPIMDLMQAADRELYRSKARKRRYHQGRGVRAREPAGESS